jgi:hypothetical protein
LQLGFQGLDEIGLAHRRIPQPEGPTGPTFCRGARRLPSVLRGHSSASYLTRHSVWKGKN